MNVKIKLLLVTNYKSQELQQKLHYKIWFTI